MAGIYSTEKACLCQADGCHKAARSAGSRYCEAHYYRLRRSGSLVLRPRAEPKATRQHTGGYILVRAPTHPLRRGSPYPFEYQHRIAFFDAHGSGPFRCHVCHQTVGWDGMHVDHLNDDPADNRVENLAAACPTCNQWRGKAKMVSAMRTQHARLLEHDGRTQSLSQWAADIGIARASLAWRLANGWSVADALSKPRGKFGPR